MLRLRRFFGLLPVFLTLLSLTPINAQAALLDVGPVVTQVNPSTEGTFGAGNPPLGHGFPLWYRDTNRVPLQLCTDRTSGMCLTAEPNPLAALSFPNNLGDELFWWSADAIIDYPQQGILQRAGQALLVMGIEAAFSTGDVVPGAQISFARIRIRIDTPSVGTYLVTTPYKQFSFTVDAAAIGDGRRAINHTEDIGIAEGGIFTGALNGNVGPFLYCTTAPIVTATGSFVGNPGVPCQVLGSEYFPPSLPGPANYFRVQGPNGFDVSTNQFAVSGKLYTDPIPTPLTVDKASYSRTAAGTLVSGFATTQALSNQTNGGAFPANFSLNGTPSALELTGTGIVPLPLSMITNGPADGKFFGVSSIFANPATMPATVSVTNTADVPQTIKVVPLVDEIVISEASYTPASKTLLVKAVSGEQISPPTLQVFFPGDTSPIETIASGQASITFPKTVGNKTYEIPPLAVTVTSTIGGSDTKAVTIKTPAIQHSINASAAANGSISPAGVTTVANGNSQTYTITPNAGYGISALVVDGTTLPGAATYTFSNVTGNHYINAYFTPLSAFTITAGAGAGGTIFPAGTTAIAGGASRTYTITPNAGYTVSALAVNGATLPGATSYTFNNVTQNSYINAYFTPVPTVTITAAAGAGGSISPAGATSVPIGTDRTFTITPAGGFQVSALVVDGVTLPGNTSHTFSNVTQNHYINAYFAPAP